LLGSVEFGEAKRAKILPARAGLKDTGADPGELAQLRWIDISFESRKVNITPVKGHKPRYADVSSEFIRRVGATPRKSENAFNYETMKSTFQDARKRLARKLNNPRLLHISFTTYRHWKGTMEYHRTHDIIHVKDLPGHSRIENTDVHKSGKSYLQHQKR
jgi:integrase